MKSYNTYTDLGYSNRDDGARSGIPAVRWIKNRLFTVILLAALFAGLFLLAYPSIADYWNSFHQSRAVMTYAENVADMNTEEYERILDEARIYNAELAERGINWTLSDEERETYMSELDISGNGVMGYIKIQKIDVMLPIYHGTEENVLQTSIGHLEESSLPVGGESTHSMLSGHRGLPSARLFTDLDKLREGDTFTLTILNETLTYEVDHIWIVEPSDLSHLTIEDGKDYCTLITCTPYGVNTHRMLVRGEHTETITEEEYKATYEKASAAASTVTSDTNTMDQGRAIPDWVPIAFAVCAVLILGFALFAPVKKKEKKDKKSKDKDNNSPSEQ